jgi:putative addiction module CopG family antidote
MLLAVRRRGKANREQRHLYVWIITVGSAPGSGEVAVKMPKARPSPSFRTDVGRTAGRMRSPSMWIRVAMASKVWLPGSALIASPHSSFGTLNSKKTNLPALFPAQQVLTGFAIGASLVFKSYSLGGGCCVNVTLTPGLERLVADKVKTGMHQTASEAIREGLRLLKQRDEHLGRLRAAACRQRDAVAKTSHSMTRYRLSRLAKADLDGIWPYAARGASAEAADRVIDRIIEPVPGACARTGSQSRTVGGGTRAQELLRWRLPDLLPQGGARWNSDLKSSPRQTRPSESVGGV